MRSTPLLDIPITTAAPLSAFAPAQTGNGSFATSLLAALTQILGTPQAAISTGQGPSLEPLAALLGTPTTPGSAQLPIGSQANLEQILATVLKSPGSAPDLAVSTDLAEQLRQILPILEERGTSLAADAPAELVAALEANLAQSGSIAEIHAEWNVLTIQSDSEGEPQAPEPKEATGEQLASELVAILSQWPQASVLPEAVTVSHAEASTTPTATTPKTSTAPASSPAARMLELALSRGSVPPAEDARLSPPAEPLAERTRPNGLALSLLPPETRVAPVKLLGERFSRLLESRSDIPVPQASVLTPAEQKSDAPVQDKNATVLARMDRFEFVARITDALEKARAQSPRHLEVDLHPPALGRMRLQVVNDAGILTARIETETPVARSLLNDQMPVLGRHLEQQGVQIQRFEVIHRPEITTAGESMLGFGQSTNSNSANQGRRRGRWNEDDAADTPRPLSMADLLTMAPGMNRLI